MIAVDPLLVAVALPIDVTAVVNLSGGGVRRLRNRGRAALIILKSPEQSHQNLREGVEDLPSELIVPR